VNREVLDRIENSATIKLFEEALTNVASHRVPDFQILHHRLSCRCADDSRPDFIWAQAGCVWCDQPFGFGVPIYRDPLNDGEMAGHLSCAIEHDGVRAWTPEHFAAKVKVGA